MFFLRKYWKWLLAAVIILWFFLKKKTQKDSTEVIVAVSKLTYDKNQYLLFADQIESALRIGDSWSPWEDDTAVGDVLKLMNNDDDYYQLIVDYGKRETTPFTQQTLPQTLESYLDEDVREAVNENWINKGMNVRL